MRTSRVVIPCVVLLSVLGLADACAEGDAPPAAEGKADYLVRPGDLLGLWVYKVPDFQIELRVAPNGNLRVPVVGSLDAAGKTLEALTEAIVEGLKKRAHLLDPQVALTVKEFAQEIAYIHGAVIGSKEFKLPNDRSMTVSQAVAVGGGLRPEARADAVRVIRRTRGGKNKEIVVDLIQVTEGGKPELDISLEPGDVVYVPYETGGLRDRRRPASRVLRPAPRPGGRAGRPGHRVAGAGAGRRAGQRRAGRARAGDSPRRAWGHAADRER
ncbi:MAG: polysaccharide export protein [Planctomycetota bacterium]|nr:polysaccharide export protein [Planctomycetota bacterium]